MVKNFRQNELTAKLRNALLISRPSPSQPFLFVDGSRISSPQAFPPSLRRRLFVNEVRCWMRMASIKSSCVRVPDVNEDIGERLTGLYVDNADVKELVD